MHIHIKGNTYLCSDTFQFWIQTETKTGQVDKNGKQVVYTKRLTGYHGDFESLFNDYFDRTVRSSEITGEMKDLVELVKKTRSETKKIMREIRGTAND